MITPAKQRQLTAIVTAETGRCWCFKCNSNQPEKDGAMRSDTKGRMRWRCAGCLAKSLSARAPKP